MTESFRLIVVTSEPDLPDEPAAWEALRATGLWRLHLRKPHWDAARTAACLERLSPDLRACVRLHDHHELAARYGLDGVHLNARHPEPPAGYHGGFSRSCHGLPEVKRYKPVCDYVFLSPVFSSLSKRGYAAAFETDRLRSAAADGTIDGRVLALGGVTAGKIAVLRGLGFGGAAVLGALWQAYAQSPSVDGLLDRWRRLRDAAAGAE